MITVLGESKLNLYLKNILSELFPEYCFDEKSNIEACLETEEKSDYVECKVTINKKTLVKKEYFSKHLTKNVAITSCIGKAVIEYAESIGINAPPYGVLIGVRPFKIASGLIEKYGKEKAEGLLEENYLIKSDKIPLLLETAKHDAEARKNHSDNDYSIYVSIPFCPSKCNYCSFISSSAFSESDMDRYVDALICEIAMFSDLATKKGLNLRSIYVGGGTPTSLNAKNLEKLLGFLKNCYDIPSLKEFTVEAGRPDSITEEKLSVIKRAGAGRICINCQTTNDDILKKIGRKHTKDDFFNAFEWARKFSFDTINTDLIAGLYGESFESFKKSIEDVISLKPENITVHTLCVKKSAEIKTTGRTNLAPKSIDDFFSFAKETCINSGYLPYYLYKQKYSLGNHENVGYSIEGHESYYNVAMMNEIETVFGFGAGATSRIVRQRYEKIEHLENYKYPAEYLKSNEKTLKNLDKVNSLF